MPGLLYPCACLVFLVAMRTVVPAFGTPLQAPGNVAEAVAARAPFHAEWYLRHGESAHQLYEGEALLVHAARSGNLELCRVLLHNGANVNFTGRNGEPLAKLVPADSVDAPVLTFLIRTWLMLDKFGRKTERDIFKHPHLVVVYEPSVDHDHPAIAPYYHVNRRELGGRENTDDDRDGFVDNVYGWSVALDRPFQLNLAQRRTWSEYRPLIHELAETNNRAERGEISWLDPEARKLEHSYRNPIAALFGNQSGCTDREFLDRIIEVSHGTHVAGTVVRASSGRALLHTISWRGFGETAFPANPLPMVQDGDPDAWLRAFQTGSLADRIAQGRRGSDYLRAVQCGVVNGSFGNSFDAHVAVAEAVWNELAQYNPNLPSEVLETIAREMYAFESIPYAIAAFENPEVLFVVSAGNDSRDNDTSYQTPGILSRYFSNVLTIAASDSAGDKAAFSNYGRKGVTIAASGVNIESDGVAGCRLLMSGTSMSAPHVSGAVAKIRADHPGLAANRIGHMLQLCAKDPTGKWKAWCAAGGVIDLDETLAVIGKQPDAVRRMAWRLYDTEPDERPEVWVTGIVHVRDIAADDSGDSLLWQSLAAVFDQAGKGREALEAIDRAIEIDPNIAGFWHSKCLVHFHAKDHDAVLGTIRQFEARFDQPEDTGRVGAEIFSMGIDSASAIRDESVRLRLSELHKLAIAGQVAGSGTATIEVEGDLRRANGALSPDDRAARFTIHGNTGDYLIVNLESAAFDTVLTIKGADGLEWKNDDREEDVRHSRLEFALPVDGEYQVIVESYDAAGSGEFELLVRGGNILLEPFKEPFRHLPATSR